MKLIMKTWTFKSNHQIILPFPMHTNQIQESEQTIAFLCINVFIPIFSIGDYVCSTGCFYHQYHRTVDIRYAIVRVFPLYCLLK